jgi:hypothetical protein
VVTARDAVATTKDPHMPRRKTPPTPPAPQPASSNKRKSKGAGGALSSLPKRTKQDAILHLLGRPNGTTIGAITQATGWQSHSVRGFLAGTVRKKLGLTLVSEKVDGQRVYRVVEKKPTKSRSTSSAPAPSAS